jgi:Cu/Ag efflux protein CusF
MKMLSTAVGIVFAFVAAAGASAESTASEKQGVPQATATVFTRARVVSLGEETGSNFYVRLQLLPRSKLPFTTQAFLARDSAMLAGISKGDWVRFTSRSIDGNNVLTAIQVAPECVRFQPCK